MAQPRCSRAGKSLIAIRPRCMSLGMIVKLHADGWLQLPPTALRVLAATTGSNLELEPDKRGLVLRLGPARLAAGKAMPTTAGSPLRANTTKVPAGPKAAQARHGAAATKATSLVLPGQIRRRGGRRRNAAPVLPEL